MNALATVSQPIAVTLLERLVATLQSLIRYPSDNNDLYEPLQAAMIAA